IRIHPNGHKTTPKTGRSDGRCVPSQIEGVAQLTSAPETETQTDAVKEQHEQDKADRGARTAENVRYGQTISEGDMGGKTTEAGGTANQGALAGYSIYLIETQIERPLMRGMLVNAFADRIYIGGFGSTDGQAAQDSAEETRQEQGYGPGSGVGA
ncbi:MAG: hypothetical protein L6R42_005515, partial [Xanthoria sp. 1 TBL-2021]